MSDKEDGLEGGLGRASKALEKQGAYQTSKSEKVLNKAGDLYENVAESPYIDATSDLVSASVSLVQTQLDNFAATCDVLMKTLDAVSQIHPFVTVAVLAFKTAITFELTRRKNDKRILALYIEMKDMMSVISLLRPLTPQDHGTDGVTIEDRLRDRMVNIANDIETCASTCDAFQKKKLIVKVFKSLSWEGKLEAFAQVFKEHKESLQDDLSMHTSLTVNQTLRKLEKVEGSTGVTSSRVSMVVLLRKLRSPEERELIDFVDNNGGPEKFLGDDQLMNELIQRSGKPVETSSAAQAKMLNEVRTDIVVDLTKIVEENGEVFQRKFKTQQDIFLQEMKSVISREGDRIINIIVSGPHEKLIDSDIYQVWKDMGWRSSAKASHLVMALRDYFIERCDSIISIEHQALIDIRRMTDHPGISQNSGSSENIANRRGTYGHIRAEDRWALQYISLARIGPLLEALDIDASTFVTVTEVNAFTQARPEGWSIPHWMAYWTIGFPLAIRQYYDRIRSTMSEIAIVFAEVLPSNRSMADRMIGCVDLRIVDALLAGARSTKTLFKWDNELFGRFKEFVVAEESRMRERLKSIKYYIDAPDALRLVLGPGRLEKNLMTLLWLLVERCLQIIKIACSYPLHRMELPKLRESMQTLWDAIRERVMTFEAMCTLQNLSLNMELKKVCFGLYYYIEHEEEVMESDYYKIDYYAVVPRRDNVSLDADPEELFYGPQKDELDLSSYEKTGISASTSREQSGSRSLLWESPWSGWYESMGLRSGFGLMGSDAFCCEQSSSQFTCLGAGIGGKFTLRGSTEGDLISFDKEYTDGYRKATWRYRGKFNSERDVISGLFGTEGQFDPHATSSSLDNRTSLGTFEIQKRPLYYYIFRPSVAEFQTNKSKALWKYALNSVQHSVRAQSGHLTWSFIKGRRDRRRRFIQLYARMDEYLGGWADQVLMDELSPEEMEELVVLEQTFSPADLSFYCSLANYLIRREVIYLENFCDSCGAQSLKTTRIVCLDCSALEPSGSVDTLDLCATCVKSAFNRQADGKAHFTSHSLLQIRRPTPNRHVYYLIEVAQSALQSRTAKDNTGDAECKKLCIRCSKEIDLPYWFCIDCQSGPYICEECNREDESNPLSLCANWESRRLPEDPRREYTMPDKIFVGGKRPKSGAVDSDTFGHTDHHWSHSLVLIPLPPEPAGAAEISAEERMASLENHILAVEESMKSQNREIMERLHRLESMLERLLGRGV